jgi:hypothetical protein
MSINLVLDSVAAKQVIACKVSMSMNIGAESVKVNFKAAEAHVETPALKFTISGDELKKCIIEYAHHRFNADPKRITITASKKFTVTVVL